MQGKLGDRRLHFCAVVLCLLAAVFAIEAKVAWFSPAGTPPAQISASKLQAADAPEHIAQALAAPIDLHYVPAQGFLLVVLAVLLTATLRQRRQVRRRVKVSACPSFSPSLFLRPPPKF